jgi:glycerol-3-phosphate dehydrogenase
VNGGALSPAARSESLARMAGEQFDVAVVGGGITGVGIALDAASRGLSVALVESEDIGYGTSSRSSKLIHGGLRYLEMLDFGLVREALSERRLLLTRIAPHLVRPVPFLFPLRHRGWERPYVGSGLLLYDAMGGARHLPRARHLSKRAALAAAPALRPDSLVGAVHFHDCQEDDALFAVYVARTAAEQGAAIATRTQAVGFVRDQSGAVTGLELLDGEGGGRVTLRARHTIAAVGVGTDRLLELATAQPHHSLRPSKGVHLLVPRSRIPMRSGLFMRTEKSIFHAIPWGSDHWLLGDTDTEWTGAPEDVVASGADAEYVLSKVNSVLRDPIGRDDVCGVFAGLRPLVSAGGGADTARLSRQHRLFSPVAGLTAIAGGKYTTYRLMARDAVDLAARHLDGGVPASRTHELPLVGAHGGAAATLDPRSGIGRGQLELLLARHGACADEVAAQAVADPALAAPIAGAERYLRAEATHAVTHQGALDLDDVLARRMRIAIEVPDRGRAAAADVAPLIAPLLGWSDERAAEQVARYLRLRNAEAAALTAGTDAEAVQRYRAVLDGSGNAPTTA